MLRAWTSAPDKVSITRLFSNSSLAFKATHLKQRVLAHTLKVAILTSYKNLSVGYIELKLLIYALGTSETNRSPLNLLKPNERVSETQCLSDSPSCLELNKLKLTVHAITTRADIRERLLMHKTAFRKWLSSQTAGVIITNAAPARYCPFRSQSRVDYY